MGHNLSLGKTSHFKAADESGDIFVDSKGMIQWKVTDPKSHLYGKTYSMGPAVWTDGYFGGKVLTNQGLKSFITNFERIIEFQSSDIDFFNTTEGGARVKGAKNISLKKYLEEKAKEEIKKEKALQPYLSPEPKYEKQIKDTIPKLERDILQLKELKLNSEKAIKLLDEIEKAKADKLPELLNEQQKYSTKAEDLAKMNPLVQVYIYNESVQIHSRQLKVKGAPEHLIEDEKDLKTRVKRSRLILVAAKEAAEIFEESYEESLNILKQFIKSKDKSILSRPPEEYCPSLEKADEMLENNSFARVLLDADKILRENPDDEKAIDCYQRACQSRDELIKEAESCEDNQPWIDYLHLIEEAQKKGRDEKDFDAALDMLKQAMELKPDKPEAIWGYATTCAHLNRNEESEKYFKQLTEKWPDNLQFAFEYALVILRIDPVEGLKAMGDVMSKTDAYDSFLISVGDLYMSSKLPEQAVNAYEQYVKKFPADAKGWEKFGLCLQVLGDDTEANMAFRKAKRLSISESPMN
jgi:Flp pilus assembly protein TadD